MKQTLLQIVQRVLSAMEADMVNSISDTAESTAVYKIAEEVFYDLVNTTDWPHLETTGSLISPSNSDFPNVLYIPEDVKYIKSLWYKDKILKYKEPEDFIQFVNERAVDTSVRIETPNGLVLSIDVNKEPEFFTIFDGVQVVTDSYNSAKEAVLVSSLSLFTGNKSPVFYTTDEFIPDLPTNVFPTYLAMVKRAAFLYLRREASPHDERVVVSGLGRIMRDKYKLYRKETKVSYGRK